MKLLAVIERLIYPLVLLKNLLGVSSVGYVHKCLIDNSKQSSKGPFS